MKFLVVLFLSSMALISNRLQPKTNSLDIDVLVGEWKLDMSPMDKTDNNFAMMEITTVEGNTFEGEFYRSGVKIKNGKINTQTGIIYGALISGDNSGSYNTTFYYKDGLLFGTTHAVDRDFLAVWTAIKQTE